LKRLWEIESQNTVGRLLENLIEYYQTQIQLGRTVTKLNETLGVVEVEFVKSYE
jgi:hypothetical protein